VDESEARVRHMLAGLVLPLIIGGGTLFPSPPPPDERSLGLLPVAVASAPAVAGVPQPCFATSPFPEDASGAQTRRLMESQLGFRLTGDGWTDPRYRPLVKIIWQGLDATRCSPYLSTIRSKNGGPLRLHAGPTRSWAWGDYGLTRPDAVTLDFAKLITAHQQGDDGRIVRLVVHELMHVYQKDRGTNPAYMRSFSALRAKQGSFSSYGSNDLEVMAEVVGYYVARCAKDNPYDTGKHDAYYAWAKKVVFDDVEFGPATGTRPSC